MGVEVLVVPVVDDVEPPPIVKLPEDDDELPVEDEDELEGGGCLVIKTRAPGKEFNSSL